MSQSLDVENNSLFKNTLNRLKLDGDNKKLQNRVTMLQLEEDRMIKKIDETRRKADNMMRIKDHNDHQML